MDFFLLIIVSCSKSNNEDFCKGLIYNSNDGNCELYGERLDFYVNGKKILTVEAGKKAIYFLKKGSDIIYNVTLYKSNLFLYEDKYLTILDDGWWIKGGCDDGSYPR